MRLIIRHVETDDYTYSITVFYPFISDSKEQALSEFEQLVNNHKTYFLFHNIEFYAPDFKTHSGKFDPPVILTVDEWFKEIEDGENNDN